MKYILSFFLTLSVLCTSLSALTVTTAHNNLGLSEYNGISSYSWSGNTPAQGWYQIWSSAESTQITKNIWSGNYNTSVDNNNSRGVFSFLIPNTTDYITGLKLKIQYANYLSDNPSEQLSIFDVTSNIQQIWDSTLETESVSNPPSGSVLYDIWNDLGSGTNYGNISVLSDGAYTDWVMIDLNQAALDYANTKIGKHFTVGTVATGNIFGGSGFILDSYFNSTALPAELVITTVPEPSSYAPLLGGLALGLVALRRR